MQMPGTGALPASHEITPQPTYTLQQDALSQINSEGASASFPPTHDFTDIKVPTTHHESHSDEGDSNQRFSPNFFSNAANNDREIDLLKGIVDDHAPAESENPLDEGMKRIREISGPDADGDADDEEEEAGKRARKNDEAFGI